MPICFSCEKEIKAGESLTHDGDTLCFKCLETDMKRWSTKKLADFWGRRFWLSTDVAFLPKSTLLSIGLYAMRKLSSGGDSPTTIMQIQKFIRQKQKQFLWECPN